MIKGIDIKNYRGFGHDTQKIPNLSKINIFIGRNNCGKSNILRFIEKIIINTPFIHPKLQNKGFEQLDYFDGNTGNSIEFSVTLDDESIKSEKVIKSFGFGEIFLTYRVSHQNEIRLINSSFHTLEEDKVRKFVNEINGVSGGTFRERLNDLIDIIRPSRLFGPMEAIFLHEHRKLADDKELRKKLNEIINYDHTQKINKKKQEALYSFVSSVLKNNIQIRVPDVNSKEIDLIMEDGTHLPLTSFGTGIQQIIILGFYIVTNEKAVFCIDEPELHLHADIQRAFLHFISQNTQNQYFISTHSNNYLDFSVNDRKLYHVYLESGQTNVSECKELEDSTSVLNDLGIRASELLQSNGVIWVEGPSDRVYIKKWLNLIDPTLQEGFHFVFQYYGGKLLSHYSVGDTDFKDYLNIILLNRNAYIVMDSDMDKPFNENELRETKRRIIDECKQKKINYWVTAGTEIENYLSNELLSTISSGTVKREQFKSIKEYYPSFDTNGKINFARNVVAVMDVKETLSNFDLSEKLEDLAENIRGWNRI